MELAVPAMHAAEDRRRFSPTIVVAIAVGMAAIALAEAGLSTVRRRPDPGVA